MYCAISRCIYSLGAIGGDANTDAFAALTNVDAFAQSAVRFADAFGFHGLVIDDNNVGSYFSTSLVTKYLAALQTLLKQGANPKFLAFNAFLYDGVDGVCSNLAATKDSRCLTTELAAYVDWFNIKAYNVADTDAAANAIYASATSAIFPAWTNVTASSKLCIGVCIAQSCSRSTGPEDAVRAEWTAYTKASGGGMAMILSSTDYTYNFAFAREFINVLQN